MAAFTAQIPNIMSQLGNSIMNSAATGGTSGLNAQSRATISSLQTNKPRIIKQQERPKHLNFQQRPIRWIDNRSSLAPEFDFSGSLATQGQWNRQTLPSNFRVLTHFSHLGEGDFRAANSPHYKTLHWLPQIDFI